MDIESELKKIELEETAQDEGLDNFLIVFNRKSDTMKYIVSEMIKRNRLLRNGILDGTINVKNAKNGYMCISKNL